MSYSGGGLYIGRSCTPAHAFTDIERYAKDTPGVQPRPKRHEIRPNTLEVR